jgi:Zn-dependent protease with chaperone function
MKARPANLQDAEERQLDHIVQEIARGAGCPPPRLFLIDAPQINAAALGRSPAEGVILVTRGLLLGLDRSETEAVVARLVSSICAGDLRVAASVLAVFQTFAFFLTVLDLPLRWSAWRTLGGLGLASVTPGKNAARLGQVAEGLEAAFDGRTIPDMEQVLARVPPRLRGVAKVALIPWIPALLIALLNKLVLFLWTAFFLGPPMSMLWRNRAFQTDALTVKLARAPDAFACALEKIGTPELPEGAEAYACLFMGVPATARGAAANPRSMTLALAPRSAERIARVNAMGRGIRLRRVPDLTEFFRHPLRSLALALLLLVLAPLVVMLVLAIAYITALAMTLGLAAGLGVVLWLA